METTIKILLRLLGMIFNLGFLLLTIYLVYTVTNKAHDYGKNLFAESAKDRPYEEISIEIEEGATPMDIANTLYEEGLVSNNYLFRLQTKMNGADNSLLSGKYVLNTQMESTEIIEALKTKPVIIADDDVRITIKEGFTIRQMWEYLESLGLVTSEEFIEACNRNIYKYNFIANIPERENRLEGYLFPDTYFVAKNSTAEQIVDKLLSQFEKVYSDTYVSRAAELGLTMDEVITMASIVEKEIQVDSERVKAASVIYNRLNSDMNLQMCSTILYALGKRKDRLLDEDLKVESPYNTYLHKGLPIGPIASPGKACIEAVLYPEDTNYLYFVLKGDDAKEHYFTNDYNSFLNAKEEYQQKF